MYWVVGCDAALSDEFVRGAAGHGVEVASNNDGDAGATCSGGESRLGNCGITLV